MAFLERILLQLPAFSAVSSQAFQLCIEHYAKLVLEYQALLSQMKTPQDVFTNFSKNFLPAFFAKDFLPVLEHQQEQLYKIKFELKEKGSLAQQEVEAWLTVVTAHLELYKYAHMTLSFSDAMKFIFKLEKTLQLSKRNFWARSWYQNQNLLLADRSYGFFSFQNLRLPSAEPEPASSDGKKEKKAAAKAKKKAEDQDALFMASFQGFWVWLLDFLHFLYAGTDEKPLELVFVEREKDKYQVFFHYPQAYQEDFAKLVLILDRARTDKDALRLFVGEFLLLRKVQRKLAKNDLTPFQKSLEKLAWPWQLTFLAYLAEDRFFEQEAASLFDLTSSSSDPADIKHRVARTQEEKDALQVRLKELDLKKREHIGFLTED